MQELPHHGERWFKEAAEQGEMREKIGAVVEQLKAATKAIGAPLGETREFPYGTITPDDEGEIRLAVTAQGGKVIIAFGKPIAWLGMSPREARQFAKALSEWADKA